MPLKHTQVSVVVGKPLPVPKIEGEPAPEVVEEWLQRYCDEVQALFQRYVALDSRHLLFPSLPLYHTRGGGGEGRAFALALVLSGVTKASLVVLASYHSSPSRLPLHEFRHKHKYARPEEFVAIS